MKINIASLLILFLLLANTLLAGINFRNTENIESALEIAKADRKLVFVDFYATWCAPCKVMDQIFEDKAVDQYFNENFVSIKIDMDGPIGKSLSNKYEIVFLPTLLILDQYGNTLSKIEKLLTGQELINTAQDALRSRSQPIASSLNNNPFISSSDQKQVDIDPNTKEQVIYVHDDRASSGRPNIMYHEAYLHLQLMDGKHQKVVKKYLSTQEDWSSDKNTKFIFDFLQDVNSQEFKYFVSNKKRFEEVVGVGNVRNTLSILIKNRLEQGYPRPSLREAITLFSYLEEKTSIEKGYLFYLDRLIIENQTLEFLTIAKDYIQNVNPYNHGIIYKYVSIGINRSDYNKHLQEYIEIMNNAVVLEGENHKYAYLLAHLYFLDGKVTSALENINNAISLAQSQNFNPKDYLKLKEKIKTL